MNPDRQCFSTVHIGPFETEGHFCICCLQRVFDDNRIRRVTHSAGGCVPVLPTQVQSDWFTHESLQRIQLDEGQRLHSCEDERVSSKQR